MEFNLSYREVIADQYLTETWKEISLNTGGTQSTLQDIKVAERANGYCYKDSLKLHTRNRFIYWRINHDILEIIEQSLDVNLSGNRIKYKFIDTPILDGITVHETYNDIIILVPTVCSVHRLIFPHPDRLYKQNDLLSTHPDLSFPSIFSEASAAQSRDPNTFHVFSNPTATSSQLPHLAASCLTQDEEALFVFSYPSGETILVRQRDDGSNSSYELKYESMVPRFLSGITDKFLSKSKDGNVGVSLLLHVFDSETYALMLCRDGHLRVWSCSKCHCIAVIDILALVGESNRPFIQGAQNHVLRKAIYKDENECLLTIFISFSSESQFYIFKPSIRDNKFKMTRLTTLYSPDKDLVDFSFTPSRIWSVWRGDDGECKVYSAVINMTGTEATLWVPVILESLPDPNQEVSELTLKMKDPQQVYIERIFHPGRFPLHIISKALSIYRKSAVTSDINLSQNVLKQQVCIAVENEIQNDLKESEVNDSDYLDCAVWCWQRFYSCCVQYYVTGLRPLGLLLLPSVSGALLLKKSTYSILRPMDLLEHVMLCNDFINRYHFIDQSSSIDDPSIAEDVVQLTHVLIYLEQQVSESFASVFEKELSLLSSPDNAMSELLEKIETEMDHEFTERVSQMLEKCKDLYQAMHKLLEMLRIDNMRTSDEPFKGIDEYVNSINHLFSSQLGTLLVSHSLHQQAKTRFIVCRNLLLVQCILLERIELDWTVLEAIRSICMPETVVLTQSSYALLWISDLPVLPTLPSEATFQRLSSIKLSPVFNLRISGLQSVSLLELFTSSTGGDQAHKSFLQLRLDKEILAHWHLSLLPYISHLAQLVWPISNSHILAEWLLSSGQHVWLQQYVRLLSNWCEWNCCTRNFLLAAALLNSGDTYVALDLFLTAAKGIFTDTFLASRLLDPHAPPLRSSINYYLKVINLLELHNAGDCVIYVANVALSVADPADPHLATLYSLKFKHHLALRHYEKAYDSLMSNPDNERKTDNLRDLVKRLFDNKKLDILLSFTYAGMEEAFTNILYTLARATDSVDNIYYDFLYSFYIRRGPNHVRLAASVMYEQGFRLMTQSTMEALEKQVKCYLVAKNTLHLCNKDRVWIIRPTDPDWEDKAITFAHSKQHALIKIQKPVDVIAFDELEKELTLASARLQLVQFDSSSLSNFIMDPKEIVALLTDVGLVKVAISVCSVFKLSYEVVFEGLTKMCLKFSDVKKPHMVWRWLVENDIQDVTVISKNPSNVAWKLLKSYLETYEEDKMTVLHKVVCTKILNMRWHIPQWLLNSYKQRNPAELLRLFLLTGRLRLAVTIAKEYILAAFGHGKERYGFSQSLSVTNIDCYIPINVVCQLLRQLQEQNKINPRKPLQKEYDILKELFDKYMETYKQLKTQYCKIRYGLHRQMEVSA